MRFSIIIPTYNEAGYLEPCLNAVRRQEYSRERFEVVVSDASSTDGTIDIAKRLADRVVVTEQRGIGLGRNVGARAAQGEVLVFVDADVVLQPAFLRTIEARFRDPGVVGVCGRALPADGTMFPRFVYHGTFVLARLLNALGLSLFPGLCVAYRRQEFFAVDGFREDFGISEDLDLSRRISRRGSCVVEPRAIGKTSTRRLEQHALSTVLFHIYCHIRYLLTGKAARRYPKSEEIISAWDLWRADPEEKKERSAAGRRTPR